MTEAVRTELPPDARRAVEAFLESLAGRNASPGTITEYRRHTTEFLAFLDARGVGWTDPDRATIRAYLSGLADRDLAASSVAGRLAAVRSLYRHALRNGRIETDPLAGVRAPRRPSRLPRVLSVDEAASLVTAPRRLRSRDEALARRDAAMLELLYATGMRISELAGLTLDRLDLDRRRLRVIGKGNKERQLLFGAPAAAALRGYLAEGRPVLAARAERHDERGLPQRRRRAAERARARGDPRPLGAGRGLAEADEPAHAAPLVRHAPARGRRRPARRAGAARPRQPADDPGLHPPLRCRPAQRLSRGASARRAVRQRAGGTVTRGDAPADAAADAEPEPPERESISVGRVLVTASLILTAAALASRILGWFRLLVIGSQFGASSELDAYFAAFRIPDAIFQLVVAGALSAALIPVFSSYRARGDEAEAWKLASSVINLVLIALVVLSGLMAIFAPVFVPLVAPGFDAPTTELTVRLTQIMLISPVLIGMGAVVSGILNSYQQFTIPSLAPLAYNLVIIACGDLPRADHGHRGPGGRRRHRLGGPPRHPAAEPGARRASLRAERSTSTIRACARWPA